MEGSFFGDYLVGEGNQDKDGEKWSLRVVAGPTDSEFGTSGSAALSVALTTGGTVMRWCWVGTLDR